VTRAVFMGTPAAAVPILGALREIADVVVVVTRPDTARGRSRRLISPAVKVAAVEWDLGVSQPTTGEELFEVVAAAEPDVAVVAAYGRLIKPALLELPTHGFVNVHYSLLPRWRGASPVVRAILAGDDESGVSLMQMDAGLDTGPVIATSGVAISGSDDAESLTATLADLGAQLLTSALPGYLSGEIKPQPQNNDAATAAAKVTTNEAHLDPEHHSAVAIDRAVRAFSPKPGAWSEIEGERLKVRSVAHADGSEISVAAGWAELVGGRVILGTRTDPLELVLVQPAGKPAMSGRDWMNGRRGEPARLR
jgi:methionyl-tRNA formyltransferase